MKRQALLFSSSALLLALSASLAAAQQTVELCLETIGCVQNRHVSKRDAEKLGCDQLWTARNAIFAVRGYCFSTARGKQEFGNQHCRYTSQNAVPLNDFERANINLIKSIEKRRGC